MKFAGVEDLTLIYGNFRVYEFWTPPSGSAPPPLSSLYTWENMALWQKRPAP